VRTVHAARRFLIWWVVLFALWMELVSSTDWSYALVGLGCGAVAAGAALLAHSTMEQRYAVDVRWLGWFARAVPGSVADTLRLGRLLFRPAEERAAGSVREVRLPQEGPRRAAGRRAVAVVVLGLAPGSYVVDAVDDRVLVHMLPNTPAGLTDEVAR
jgi:multisubunit Na+/H+ antiporter MnhE subunit